MITKMCRLIGVGDNTVDTYINSRMQYPGGNAVNVAVLAKRLGHDAAYIGWLGDDERGDLVLSSLESEGIDTTHCRIIKGGKTGFSTVEIIDGDRVFGEADDGVCHLLNLEKKDFNFISTFDVVHTSVFSHVEPQLADLSQASKLLSFDLSQNYEQNYLETVLPYVDVAFLSVSDVPKNEQEPLMRHMHTMGPRIVVTTNGKYGSWVYDGKEVYHQGIIQVEAIDSLGAGDAFAACFLVEFAEGKTIPLAMEKAAQYAAKNCTHYGAFGYGKSY
ncbi:MAG: PfkB family carbohydrate kinase [Anaerolineae bacterium]|nr:PfkB family carbohydrate kinase [Anaerolineae bacterium]